MYRVTNIYNFFSYRKFTFTRISEIEKFPEERGRIENFLIRVSYLNIFGKREQ